LGGTGGQEPPLTTPALWSLKNLFLTTLTIRSLLLTSEKIGNFYVCGFVGFIAFIGFAAFVTL